MYILKKINESFLAGNRSDKVTFVVNDTIQVIKGKFKGVVASVVSLASTEPEATYHLERFNGYKNITLPQSSMKIVVPSETGVE